MLFLYKTALIKNSYRLLAKNIIDITAEIMNMKSSLQSFYPRMKKGDGATLSEKYS